MRLQKRSHVDASILQNLQTKLYYCKHFSKGGVLPVGNTTSLTAYWLMAFLAKPRLAQVAVTQANPAPAS